MIVRYVFVVFGALVITGGLLYFMQSVAVRMTGGDTTLYYLVNDFIPAPDRGRQRPAAPPVPEAVPVRPGISARDELPEVVTEAPGAAAEAESLRIEPVQPLQDAGQAPTVVPE